MDFNLTVQKREILGKKSRNLREEDQILGNVQGKGIESVPVQADRRTMQKVVNDAGKNHPIELTIDGADNHLVLVNNVERDNITQNMHHVTFQVIKRGQKVSTEIPIHITGDAPAEREGHVLVTMLDEVTIEANPKDIPEAFEVNVDKLAEVGDSISVGDIKVPEGVEMMSDESLPVVKIEPTRANIEEDDESEGEEGEEGEGGESAEGESSEEASESGEEEKSE